MRYIKLVSGAVFLFLCTDCNAQSKAKKIVKYIGNYQLSVRVDGVRDTISGMAFFTSDSFAIIYQLARDSNYSCPLYKGSWALKDDTTAELKFNDGIISPAQFNNDDDKLLFLHIGRQQFAKDKIVGY